MTDLSPRDYAVNICLISERSGVWMCKSPMCMCVPHVVEFLSIFQHCCSYNAVMKPVRLYLLKEKRKTANGKRKPETEGISITCAGTEPNQNSMPGHARRGCCPVPGEGMQLGALGLLRHTAEKGKGSTPICLLLTTGKHQHFWKVTLISLSGVFFFFFF